jgi:MFS family permease
LVGAQFLAETGDGVVMIAMPLYVLAETGSAIAMSFTFAGEMLGGALLGVVGGVLADRFDRQRVLKASYLVRAILLVAAWLLSPVAAVVMLGVLARALGQLDNPSFDALIPEQVSPDGSDLQQVLSLRRFIQGVSIVVGPAVGAFLVWGLGEQPTLGAAAWFFVGGIAIHLTLPGLDRGAGARRAEQGESTWLDLARGLGVIVTTPFVRRLVLYWMLSMVTVSMAMAAAVVWFEETIDAADYWYGLSISAYGIGSASATLLFGGRRFTMSLPGVLLIAAPVYAATCALCVVAEVPWLFPFGWLLWGLAFGPEIVRAEPEFVSRIESATLGRAYAGLNVGVTLGMSIGYAVAGPLLDRYGARTTTYVTAVLILAVGAMWIGPARRREGAAEAVASAAPDPHLCEVRTTHG